MYPSLLAAGLAVAAANALLVVPESSQIEFDIVDTIPFEAQSQSRSLDLACPSCPLVTSSDGRAAATTDIPNHLLLSFNVDQTGQTDKLLLNGFELFPNPVWAGPLKAAQLPDEPATSDASVPEGMIRELGYSLAVHPVGGAEDHSAELLEVSLRIVEIGNVVVDRVPTVVAHVIKLVDGTLMIASVEAQEPPAPPSRAPGECSTTFCQLRELVSQHLATLGSKISKHCGGAKSHNVEPAHREHGHHGHHGHRHNHGPKGYGRKHHSWRHLLRSVVSHIVLPVLIGVVAGITASVIGMIVGTFAVCLWRIVVLKRPAFPRRVCRHGCRRAAHRNVAADDEKAGLMSHEEPPVYNDNDSSEPPSSV